MKTHEANNKKKISKKGTINYSEVIFGMLTYMTTMFHHGLKNRFV